jgi:hypothetical protein
VQSTAWAKGVNAFAIIVSGQLYSIMSRRVLIIEARIEDWYVTGEGDDTTLQYPLLSYRRALNNLPNRSSTRYHGSVGTSITTSQK